MGSDISILLAIGFISMFLLAGSMARNKKGLAHHRMILASMTAMVLYLVYYIQVRYLGVASAMDQMSFQGPHWVYIKILRPLLFIHVIIVCVSLYLSFYMLINGFMAKFPLDDGSLTLRTGLMKPSLALWGISAAWLVFLLWMIISHPAINNFHKALILTLGYLLPAASAILIHKALPKADRRHRIIGRITIFCFSLMLITTAGAYFLLYIARY